MENHLRTLFDSDDTQIVGEIHNLGSQEKIDFWKEINKKVGEISPEDIDLFVDNTYNSLMELLKNNRLEAPKFLAKLIEKFDLENKKEVGQLYLEWTIREFVESKANLIWNDIDFVYNYLIEKQYHENSKYVFNDLDNSVFYIPNKTSKIIALTSQSLRFLIIKDKDNSPLFSESLFSGYGVYRYWDSAKERLDEKNYEEENQEYCNKGLLHALTNADWILEEYSDNVENNKFIHRPDLQWFKGVDFNRAEISRNVFSSHSNLFTVSRGFFDKRDNNVIHYYSVVKQFFYEFCSIYLDIKEMVK